MITKQIQSSDVLRFQKSDGKSSEDTGVDVAVSNLWYRLRKQFDHCEHFQIFELAPRVFQETRNNVRQETHTSGE